MSIKTFFSLIFAVFLSLVFASCAPNSQQEPQIRIVDLDGKPRGVVTRTPSLNVPALEMQGNKATNYTPTSQPAPQITSQNLAPSAPDYGNFSAKAMQQFLQPNNSAPINKSENPIVANKADAPTVEYDLSKTDEQAAPPQKSNKNKVIFKKSAPSSNELFVQVGSFANINSAKQTLAKMEKFHAGKIETVEGDTTIYRALLGPFANKKKALEIVKKIKASGHEAVLMRQK